VTEAAVFKKKLRELTSIEDDFGKLQIVAGIDVSYDKEAT